MAENGTPHRTSKAGTVLRDVAERFWEFLKQLLYVTVDLAFLAGWFFLQRAFAWYVTATRLPAPLALDFYMLGWFFRVATLAPVAIWITMDIYRMLDRMIKELQSRR